MQQSENTPAPTRGVPVDLGDGVTRYLRYPWRVIKKIREEFGEDALTKRGLDNLGKILLYGLGDNPGITEAEIEDLVDMQNLPEVMQAMTAAMGTKAQKIAIENPQAPSPAAAESASASE